MISHFSAESISPFFLLAIVYLYYETATFDFIPEVNCKDKLLVNLDYLEVPEIGSLH